jgi:bifunctional DNA-binding transcriptional regulator/antitoxin component of YhaV-PrlF toxin-antitoxin module
LLSWGDEWRREGEYGKIYLRMTSKVSTKGQTVIPRELRQQFGVVPGSTLAWSAGPEGMKVVKLEPAGSGGFLAALRRLGAVPAAERDKRPMEKA